MSGWVVRLRRGEAINFVYGIGGGVGGWVGGFVLLTSLGKVSRFLSRKPWVL